jgi:DNA transformation protein
MPVSDEFIAFVYAGDLFFAILVDDMLYLKVDEANRAEYEARGLKPFSYRMKGGRVAAMSYYPPPPEALEDPAIRREWVMKALDAAERSRKGKQVRRRRAKGPGRSV